MSSHREAPESSKDPSADNTDVYAFMTPNTYNVNIIANFIPFELPYGGPNFAEFSDDVIYDINISNSGDAQADIIYRFEFTTTVRNQDTFLYNTGPIGTINDPNWNRPQTYKLTKYLRGQDRPIVLGTGIKVPPVNVGARSTPNYGTLANQAVTTIGRRRVFAGQRSDAFFVDLGSIFDLGGLRPLNEAHLIPLQNMPGVNGLQGLNVHTIALQLPRGEVTQGGYLGSDVNDPRSVIGVWATARRAQSRVFNTTTGMFDNMGSSVQVSRLGNPLFNEVLTPMAKKDYWNSQAPADDSQFAQYVNYPELQKLLPVLYPGAFPNLAAYNKPRADLAAILLTGIPQGVVPGLNTYTGPVQADMLRLNTSIPPTTNKPNPMGVLGGDLAGFPNGRRPLDNVTKIELQAIAGATIPLVDKSYTPDAVVGSVTDGTTNTNIPLMNDFPWLGTPAAGYQSMPGTPSIAKPAAG